jgi:hypothetical protein
VVITGCENVGNVDQALHVARTFQPMTKDEDAALLERTKPKATAGEYEPFRTSSKYDGTAKTRSGSNKPRSERLVAAALSVTRRSSRSASPQHSIT